MRVMNGSKSISQLPRLVAAAAELADELHRVELPPCNCGQGSAGAAARGEGTVPIVGVETWCHTHRARYFASQLAREMRVLVQGAR
jgi:hypothetical protein